MVEFKTALHSVSRFVRSAFKADPRRASLVAVSLVMALILTSGGVVALVDSNSDQASSNRWQDGERANQEALGSSASGDSDTSTTTETTDEPTPMTSENGNANQANGGQQDSQPSSRWSSPRTSGLTLDLMSNRSTAATGQTIDFTAQLRDRRGAMLSLSWDFGDGTTRSADPQSCSAPINRPSVEDGRTEFDHSVSHMYRSPGTYDIRLEARTGSRCGANARTQSIVAVGTVTITGPTLTNGPSLPSASAAVVSGGTSSDSELAIDIRAQDSDGYISKIVVDWDDQSSPTVLQFPLSDCLAPAGRWPSSNRSITPQHEYAAAGQYDITVTVTSTGCDGTQPQQAIAFLNGVSAGGTTPEP